MGGRGANSTRRPAGTFRNTSDLEKSLSGPNDPMLREYSNAYSEEASYNNGLRNNLNRAIDEDGYSAVESTVQSEMRYTRNELNSMPSNMTPSELGRKEALKERVEVLRQIQRRKGESGSGRGNVSIV